MSPLSFPHTLLMSSIRLPDAMPEISKPTLLVVCDTHHSRLINLGGHSVTEKEVVASKEHEYTERQSSKPSGKGGGAMVGIGETDQVESNRLKTFANTLVKHLESSVREQKIEELHISAPGKFLSVLKDHLTPALTKVLKQTLDGIYVKEHALELIARFRPDLKKAVADLRAQENYSPKNHLPK